MSGFGTMEINFMPIIYIAKRNRIMDEVNKDTVAEQLAKISEQLAIKNRRSKRIWKIVGIVLLTILALNLLLAIFGMSAYTSFSTDGKTTVIEMNEDSVSYEE